MDATVCGMARGDSAGELLEVPAGSDAHRVILPQNAVPPFIAMRNRLIAAIGLVVFVAAVAYIGRDGYVDGDGDPISILDAIYYASVSITTTGYGDITPQSDTARLMTVLLVTPARVTFLIILVGTTLEVLTERTRTRLREARWRTKVKNHYIVCGYGVKGRSAVDVLLARDVSEDRILVIDSRREAIDRANSRGLAGIHGNAASTDVLRAADIARCQAVIVAPQEDDAAVLIVLTARQLAKGVNIVASVREKENIELLDQSGANSVITSSESAGRLLGLAVDSPRLVRVLEELATTGLGLDIAERVVEDHEVGPVANLPADQLVVAVVRRNQLHRFDEEEAARTEPGDRLVYLYSNHNRLSPAARRACRPTPV